MEVINVSVFNIRPTYDNLKEWMENDNNIYIGRPAVVFIDGQRFPKKSSIWANPYKIGCHGTREEVLKKYEKYIRHRLETNDILINKLKDLQGKTLGCWCKPEACHGDILIKLINEY